MLRNLTDHKRRWSVPRPDLVKALPGLGFAAEKWEIPTLIVALHAKRRLTVPAALAPASPGDNFDARFDPEEDAFVFRRLAGKANWLTVLKACPVSPDDVPSRSRASARRRKV